MEKVLTTNNGQAGWEKLSVFGLHNRRSVLGFNRYSGRNGAVLKIDPATGMRVMFYPAQAPKSERTSRTITLKTPGKRGRPAIFSHPKQAHESGILGRPRFIGPKEELVFSGPLRKRGRKLGFKVQPSAETLNAAPRMAQKRGRMNEAERIKAAKIGDMVKATGGGFWLIIAPGLPTYISA